MRKPKSQTALYHDFTTYALTLGDLLNTHADYERTLATAQHYSGPLFFAYRRFLKLTQRAMAERLGITNVHLCNVERGKASPGIELFRKLDQVAKGKR